MVVRIVGAEFFFLIFRSDLVFVGHGWYFIVLMIIKSDGDLNGLAKLYQMKSAIVECGTIWTEGYILDTCHYYSVDVRLTILCMARYSVFFYRVLTEN